MTAASGEAFADFFYAASDGLRLHARVYDARGYNTGPEVPVVCLPGLTRNARDFHELALHLSCDAPRPRRVVAMDYRGRGQSAHDPAWTNYTVAVEARDALAGLDALAIAKANFIGTSRGGLILHLLAEMRPAALNAVVLNDIGPVVEAEGLAHIHAYLNRAAKPETFADAVRIQREIHGAAFPVLTDADWERHTRAIYGNEGGQPIADYDPAVLGTLSALDPGQSLPTLWDQFSELAKLPVLVIRGANSGLLSDATLREMARRHPGLQAITVSGQGHAPMLYTGDLPRRIAAFFDRV